MCVIFLLSSFHCVILFPCKIHKVLCFSLSLSLSLSLSAKLFYQMFYLFFFSFRICVIYPFRLSFIMSQCLLTCLLLCVTTFSSFAFSHILFWFCILFLFVHVKFFPWYIFFCKNLRLPQFPGSLLLIVNFPNLTRIVASYITFLSSTLFSSNVTFLTFRSQDKKIHMSFHYIRNCYKRRHHDCIKSLNRIGICRFLESVGWLYIYKFYNIVWFIAIIILMRASKS